MSEIPSQPAGSFRFSLQSLILFTAYVSLFFGFRTAIVFQGMSYAQINSEADLFYLSSRAFYLPPLMSLLGCIVWLNVSDMLPLSFGRIVRRGIFLGGLISAIAASFLILEVFIAYYGDGSHWLETTFLTMILFVVATVQGATVGMLMAVTKVVVFEKSCPQPNRSDITYCMFFFLMAIGMLVGSFSLPLGWILRWSSLSFAFVAITYYKGLWEPLGKRRHGDELTGTRPWLHSLLLLPYLALTHVVWILQVLVSNKPAYNVVNESLIVARRLHASEYPEGVTLICDLTAEFYDPKAIRRLSGYRSAPILDAGAISPYELASLVRELKLQPGERLLIHCTNGHGRTGMVAAAWLVTYGYAKDIDEAVKQLREVRPGIRLRKYQRQAAEQAANLTVETFD